MPLTLQEKHLLRRARLEAQQAEILRATPSSAGLRPGRGTPGRLAAGSFVVLARRGVERGLRGADLEVCLLNLGEALDEQLARFVEEFRVLGREALGD